MSLHVFPQIVYVDPNGLASRHGLPPKAPGMDGSQVNWALTEINMRPLNLFPKQQEVYSRTVMIRTGPSI